MKVLGSLIALAVASSLVAVPHAKATPMSYIIDAGTHADLSGTTVSITGSFTFDAATDTESSVQLFVTGGVPYTGTYIDTLTDISQLEGDALNNVVCGTDVKTLCLGFVNPLDVSPDTLDAVGFGDTPNSIAIAFDASPVGAASLSVIAVPEPTSLALFASALVALGFLTRRKPKTP